MPDPIILEADLLSPAPILEAVERYRGTIVDLDAGQRLSGDQFARARERLIARLRGSGLQSGDRAILALANGPLFIATLTAILACDASPLLVHAKTPPGELDRWARRYGARFLACAMTQDTAACGITSPSEPIEFGQRGALCITRLEGAGELPRGPTLRGVPMHPTSGSTGRPKLALRPGLAALEVARHYAATMSIDSHDTIVAIPPMSHAYGYGLCVMVPLLTGANIVSMRRFSGRLIQKAVCEHRASIVPLVPAMLEVLALSGTNLRPARWVLAAGSLLSRRLAGHIKTKTGATPRPVYGTTETGVISLATAADGGDVDGRVGPPMKGVEVEVRAAGQASEMASETGKLFVRSSSMMSGYLDEQGCISNPIIDGWFETGDLARIDKDGAIHLRGRDREVINVSGLKVVPCEVEETIAQLPGVLEVMVYAGEHHSGTQVVKAAVAVESNVTEADIRSHCEQHLVYYKRPQLIAVLAALPRTPTGKIIRSQLP